jgi:hypothetical protein
MNRVAQHSRLGCALVAICVLLLAPTAIADSSTETFAGQGGGAEARIQRAQAHIQLGQPNDGASGSTAGSGTLPFTGADIALAAMGGLVLVGAGVILARLSERRHNPTDS